MVDFDEFPSSLQNPDEHHQNQRQPIKENVLRANEMHQRSLNSNDGSNELLFYKLSKRRWAILAGITIFGFSNGFVNELTAILGTMVSLVGLPLDEYVYLAQAFNYIAPAFALPTAYLIDRHGLRAAALAALMLTVVRNLTRSLLFWPQSAAWSQLKFLYWALTSCSSAQVASIYWCLPLKVSESWFPENERSFAWSCMVAGPLLGTALSSLWTPWVVAAASGSTRPLAYANLLALAITLLAVCLCVNRSQPSQFPSARQQAKPATLDKRPLGQNIKCLLANKDVLLIILTLGSFEAGESSIRGLMQDILAASGFSQTFCGQYLASVSFMSVLLQLFSASMEPDNKPSKTSRCKLYASIQWLVFVFYSLTLAFKQLHCHHWWLILASSLLYTICRVWASPIYNNQLAHLIAGSMSEATVGAAGTIACYLLTSAYTVIFVYFRRVDQIGPNRQQQQSGNYLNSIMLLLALVSSSSLLYLLSFSGDRCSNNNPQVQGFNNRCNNSDKVASEPSGGRRISPAFSATETGRDQQVQQQQEQQH